MAEIEHIVYLMLENRSLDNVLGWLYEGDRPQNCVPADAFDQYDGLNPELYNDDAKGRKHFVIRGTGGKRHVPKFDPHEVYSHVNAQLFDDSATPVRPTRPTMGGFVKDYATWYRPPAQIMMSYAPDDLPVLNGLARKFAVSDRYFSSVPTQTNCNRAFAAAGNSLGPNAAGALQAWVDNRNSGTRQLGQPSGRQFDQRTIWNVLSDSGKDQPSDWMIFNSEGNWLENRLGAEGYQYTRKIMERIQDPSFDPHFSTVGSPGDSGDTLFGQIATDSLPTFSFVEPQWGLQKGFGLLPNGTDYHPPSDLLAGEVFLNSLYEAVSANENVWKKMLFIVNFDEHGGTYDHVPPPWTAAPPWLANDDTPQPEFLEGGFEFDRFGVRVPLILVSPWITKSTVFRAEGDIPYDHTSVIATVLDLMGVDDTKWKLGARVARAPRFHNVLNDQFRNDIPRFEPAAA